MANSQENNDFERYLFMSDSCSCLRKLARLELKARLILSLAIAPDKLYFSRHNKTPESK